MTGRSWYQPVRSLHLYAGLFLSPFVVLFALSVVLVNHPGIPLGGETDPDVRTALVEVPSGLASAKGMDQAVLARKVLDQAGVLGEIYFANVRNEAREMSIRVTRPRHESMVELNLATGAAAVEERSTGFLDSLIYLHKMPGPHLANIRGNW